jgi:hypothetical protein
LGTTVTIQIPDAHPATPTTPTTQGGLSVPIGSLFDAGKGPGVWVVVLTALAAILALIPLTHSVFWGNLTYTLIGGTFAGTILTLVFLPAMYSIWFKIRPVNVSRSVERGEVIHIHHS